MLKSYLKITYRNLLKNKVFSVVNISGLAIGMAACFFIFQYVHFESSYDNFHKQAADIYRVNISFSGSFASLHGMPTNHPAVGPAMKAEFPEVKDYARVVGTSLFMSASTISYNNVAFNEEKIYVADPSFLTMFSFPFIKGDPSKALVQGSTVVISKTMAAKYFGKNDPMGKILNLNRDHPLTVTGVFEDVPENSHLKFDMLVSFRTFGENWGFDNWGWPEFYTYVALTPGADPKKVEAKFPAFINKYLANKMKELNFGTYFHMQHLTDIHLKSDELKGGPEANGSEREIYFLSVIGIFILIIAWINYINLSTAKNIERAKEVGLRKAIGAVKSQVIGQFILESVIINLLALVLAVLIVFLCFPFFGAFIGKDILRGSVSSGIWHAPEFWPVLFSIFIAGTFIVGAYPAFVLSTYKPAIVLKGKFFQSAKGILLRKGLVSFQFILSLLLIAGTIMVYWQLSYMRNQELGYNQKQIVVVKRPPVFDSTFAGKIASFKALLLNNPAVTDVATSSDIPGKVIIGRNNVRKGSEDKTHNFITNITQVDESFVKTFQMQLAAGRSFTAQDTADIANTSIKTRVVINEQVVKALGFKDNEAALHQYIVFGGGMGEVNAEVVGVLKNYHQRSLKEDYDPILYFYPSPSHSDASYFSINVKTDHLQRNLSSIEDSYKSIFSDNPFEYFFLNEYFDKQYQSEQRFGKVFGLFTILAIIVACLGLLGLSSFVIKLRTKEIGIRKVLGASVYSLLALFSKDFIKLVLLASVIVIPFIYFIGNMWLQNYAFHIHLNWIFFVVPPLLLMTISLITISLQSVKAALANPIKSLKTE
jgi:putative ABC transport system permease protein